MKGIRDLCVFLWPHRNLLLPLNCFLKVKLLIYKNLHFYALMNYQKIGILKIPFIIVSKNKILGSKFNQGCETENCETLMKEIKEDMGHLQLSICLWLES